MHWLKIVHWIYHELQKIPEQTATSNNTKPLQIPLEIVRDPGVGFERRLKLLKNGPQDNNHSSHPFVRSNVRRKHNDMFESLAIVR